MELLVAKGETTIIKIDNWMPGIYLLRMIAEKDVVTQKIVKE